MLPPFLPFTSRPSRQEQAKRSASTFVRELSLPEAHSVKAERLVMKAGRAPASGRLRVLDRT